MPKIHPFPFLPTLPSYDFIITILAMSKDQLRRGCTAQSTLQKQNKGEFLLHWACSNSSKWGLTKCNVRGGNTAGGAKCLLCFLIIPIKWFFSPLNHILWLKSQSLLRASSRTHRSLKKATNQTHKTTWKPSFLELQRNPAWIHLWQLTAAKLHTDSSSCSESPAASASDAIWWFSCVFRCQDHFGKLHTWANTWSSWLKI